MGLGKWGNGDGDRLRNHGAARWPSGGFFGAVPMAVAIGWYGVAPLALMLYGTEIGGMVLNPFCLPQRGEDPPSLAGRMGWRGRGPATLWLISGAPAGPVTWRGDMVIEYAPSPKPRFAPLHHFYQCPYLKGWAKAIIRFPSGREDFR